LSEVTEVTSSWTTVEQLVRVLHKRWDRGIYLKQYLGGEPWEPLALAVKGPGARELLGRLDDVRRWLVRFSRDAKHFVVEYEVVKGRHLGTNRIPTRVRVESFAQLCQILGTSSDVRTVDSLIVSAPELREWVVAHPMVALQNADVWEQAVEVVRWMVSHDLSRLYLRQIDVAGVDTKFVERHHRLLDQLLTVVLPPGRINPNAGGFSERFGFLDKPAYVRFRVLDPGTFDLPFSEMTVRIEELAEIEPSAASVFIVENEITYLAFPPVPKALVMFGSGFALTELGDLPWMHGKELVYWGDIDTHGFDILNRLRARFPAVRSILMDRSTLLSHKSQWVTEPLPTSRALPHLTPEETALYRDLVEETQGPSLRLEQERVRFSLVDAALAPWL